MTKKGGANKKGQVLSLHDFITNTPGALPLEACLPTKHGEVSKFDSGSAPQFGDLSLNRRSRADHQHEHPLYSGYVHSSPYGEPTYSPPVAPPRAPYVSHSSPYGGGSSVDNGYGMFGSIPFPPPPPPPPPPRRQQASAPTQREETPDMQAGNGLDSRLEPGQVKLLTRRPEVQQGKACGGQQQQWPSGQDEAEIGCSASAPAPTEHERAAHEEAVALEAAAHAKADAVAATEVPLLVTLSSPSQQAVAVKAAEVKNAFAEKMAQRALERMAIRSELQSTSAAYAAAPATTAASDATQAQAAASAAAANGEGGAEKSHTEKLKDALDERERERQHAATQHQASQQRPRLHLLPRSKPLDMAGPSAVSSKLFGGACPRDEKVHALSAGSAGSGSHATSLANVQLHSLSASYSHSRGGSVASNDDAWHTVGSRGRSRADSLSTTANCDDLDPFFAPPLVGVPLPPPPPPRLVDSGYHAHDDGARLWGKRGLPVRNTAF